MRKRDEMTDTEVARCDSADREESRRSSILDIGPGMEQAFDVRDTVPLLLWTNFVQIQKYSA